jgi:hypothetical protein
MAAAAAGELQLTDMPDAVIFPNKAGTVSAGQVYATAMQATRNGSGLLIYASVASVQVRISKNPFPIDTY